MDHLSHLTRQAEKEEAQDSPTSTAPSPELNVTAMPSMREADSPQQLLQGVPPSALQQTDRNSAPVLVVGIKRSAADAGLETDAAPDGKRLKVSHAAEPDAERLKEEHPVTPDPLVSRKRNALDAGFDEGDLPPAKRPRLEEPNRLLKYFAVSPPGDRVRR